MEGIPFEYFRLCPGIPGLRHVITTREGGVSREGYAALNVAYHVGDDAACVTENRRRLGRAAGYAATALVAAQQVHGNTVRWVGEEARGRGAYSWDDALPDTDGLLVADSGIPVMIQVADCAPVLIVDPVRHVLAVVHAGWRGAVGRIASAAVDAMAAEAGSDPHDLYAGIGPTLCAACFEIGDEVADVVRAQHPAAVLQREGARPHLDVRGLIAANLASSGVQPRYVEASPACPRCHTARFFSHRSQHGQAGRFALVAWWEN